jgi:hypothetical protein
MISGNNRLFSLSAAGEFVRVGGTGLILLGGDIMLFTSQLPLISTGQLTITGEVVALPAEQIGKILL